MLTVIMTGRMVSMDLESSMMSFEKTIRLKENISEKESVMVIR